MSIVTNIAEKFDPNKGAGNVLLVLNVFSMIFAAASNTFAAAKDKNTSAEDKKFLVPAGALTGVANIGVYFAITRNIIQKLEDSAAKTLENMKESDIAQKAKIMAQKSIDKAQKGLFKKSNEHIEAMKTSLLKDGIPTQEAKDLYKKNFKQAAGVLGAFAGAVIGCSILTPVIRDLSAYFVQRRMEKGNPEMQNAPYRPYFDPAHLQSGRFKKVGKQPLSMKSYMTFTNGKMKI